MLSSHSIALRCKTEPAQAQLIAQVFARFIAIYGHRWTSVYTTPELAKLAQSEWLDSLGDYTVSQINRSIRAAIKSGNGFPPTLPEFVATCRCYWNDDYAAEIRRRESIPAVVDEAAQARSRKTAKDAIDALMRKFNWSSTREGNR